MSKHTPGPWKVNPARNGLDAYVLDSKGESVALTEMPDAYLIAAAPELLGALREAASILGLHGQYVAQVRARAVIAKAEGKE